VSGWRIIVLPPHTRVVHSTVRYGVLSDIHGNLTALQAAIDALRRERVDAWLCAGDLVGYGPQPNECIEVIAELDGLCVAGNHELILLGQLSDQRCGRLARETILWTRDVLRADCLAYLSGLPRVVATPSLVMTHGSLDDPEEYVLREPQAEQQLHRLGLGYPQARLLILGHTHSVWMYSEMQKTVRPSRRAIPLVPSDRLLLNPGSVGQSRQRERVPRARFMVLDLDRWQAQFHSTSYDVEACRAALRREGLPLDCIHRPPGRLAAVRRRGRSLLRQALRPRPTYLR